ncbi:hypothetical protein [Streptomyces sp. NPDC006552]|uniref:hypothetical protein n=1 Tax=Streptomyces sp. NPDC006552 TaxID=3157179 RepID=UPI0033A753D9
MRTTRALAVSAVVSAAVGLTAPTASAWTEPSTITAGPGAVPRGGQLTVTVTGPTCRSGGVARSDAFGTAALTAAPGSPTASGTATIRGAAGPGAHDISVNCQGVTVTRPAAFTVIQGGVNGGFGGAREGGATPTDMAIGGVLVATSLIGGGVFWLRRRAENKN